MCSTVSSTKLRSGEIPASRIRMRRPEQRTAIHRHIDRAMSTARPILTAGAAAPPGRPRSASDPLDQDQSTSQTPVIDHDAAIAPTETWELLKPGDLCSTASSVQEDDRQTLSILLVVKFNPVELLGWHGHALLSGTAPNRDLDRESHFQLYVSLGACRRPSPSVSDLGIR